MSAQNAPHRQSRSLSHIFERGIVSSSIACARAECVLSSAAIGRHPGRSLECPAEVRLRQPRGQRGPAASSCARQVGVHSTTRWTWDDDSPSPPRQPPGARRRAAPRWPRSVHRHRVASTDQVIHSFGEQFDRGPDPIVGKAQPRRGGCWHSCRSLDVRAASRDRR